MPPIVVPYFENNPYAVVAMFGRRVDLAILENNELKLASGQPGKKGWKRTWELLFRV